MLHIIAHASTAYMDQYHITTMPVRPLEFPVLVRMSSASDHSGFDGLIDYLGHL